MEKFKVFISFISIFTQIYVCLYPIMSCAIEIRDAKITYFFYIWFQ